MNDALEVNKFIGVSQFTFNSIYDGAAMNTLKSGTDLSNHFQLCSDVAACMARVAETK